MKWEPMPITATTRDNSLQQPMRTGTIMTPLQRYISEEIAIDHADGLLSRREALRRLGLIGLGVAAASSLLAACATDSEESPTSAPVTPGGATPPPPGAAEAVETEAVTFPGPDGRVLQGAWADAATPRGAVLVIHENKGLTDHIRSVAGRFGVPATPRSPSTCSRKRADRDVHRSGAGHRRAGHRAAGTLRRRHEGRNRRTRAAGAGREDGGGGVLLRRRDGVATPHVR